MLSLFAFASFFTFVWTKSEKQRVKKCERAPNETEKIISLSRRALQHLRFRFALSLSSSFFYHFMSTYLQQLAALRAEADAAVRAVSRASARDKRTIGSVPGRCRECASFSPPHSCLSSSPNPRILAV